MTVRLGPGFRAVRCIPVLVCLFILFSQAPCHAVRIAADGRPLATIIIGSGQPETVRYAAREFRSYVEKISGARLPIQTAPPDEKPSMERGRDYVLIGESPYTRKLGVSAAGLRPDGFRIIARGNCLVLIGRDYAGPPMTGMSRTFSLNETYNPDTGISAFGQTGTLYAVYRFLEKYLGVRWYMPGRLGEVIEKRASIRIADTQFEASPDFTYRRWYFAYGFGSRQYDEAARWYRRAGFGADFPVELNDTFDIFAKKYLGVHPEYFYCNGKVRPHHIVLDQPGVAGQFVKDINAYFDSHPLQRVYPLMADDFYLGTNSGKDKRLKAADDPSMGPEGRFSDYMWGFVNRVAEEVYKTHPHRFIGGIAYQDYRLPPRKIKRFPPNVLVMICKLRMQSANAKERAKVDALIRQWRKKCANIYVWEYYNWYYAGSEQGEPFIFPHLIARDLKFLKGMSRGEFIEAETAKPPLSIAYPGLTHLNLYVTARLLWDADLNVDRLLDDYYRRFYGPGAPEMKEFFEAAERYWTQWVRGQRIRKWYWEGTFRLAPRQREKLLGYLEKAREKTGDTVYGKRVQLIIGEMSHA
ncbi:MAG: DUF4838 domain-containing protein [Nitrospiraceae bacterium]|nr:DUF4838 domain-containing protein [Nitrospiraceae bacterium]